MSKPSSRCATGWREHLYVTSHGGNLAWKLEDDLLLMTPTQVNKGVLRAEDVVFINLQGKVIEGTRRPTGETPMYLKFFCERPDIVSVIHCHPPAVCALAINTGKNWLMRPLFPETTIEIGPVPVVPYAEPLTEELAQNFLPFLARYNSFIMENHGLVTMSRGDIEWTLLKVEVLEQTAHSIILALQAGGIKEIEREAVRRLEQRDEHALPAAVRRAWRGQIAGRACISILPKPDLFDDPGYRTMTSPLPLDELEAHLNSFSPAERSPVPGGVSLAGTKRDSGVGCPKRSGKHALPHLLFFQCLRLFSQRAGLAGKKARLSRCWASSILTFWMPWMNSWMPA